MSQSLILLDALSSAYQKKKKKKRKGRNGPGAFSPGLAHHVGCAMLGFSDC
jgi:hypothetical protein